MSGSLDEPSTSTYLFELSDGLVVKVDLPVPHRQIDAEMALHNMAGLFAEEGRPIQLDLSTESFCILLPYLKSGVVPRRSKIADWVKFSNACDYLGVSRLPDLVTDDSEHVYRSALTYPALVDREVEKRIRELHAARADGCDDPPADMGLYAKLNERKLGPHDSIGLCSTIELARIGQLIHELSPTFNVPLDSQAFVHMYPYVVHHSIRAEQLEYVRTVAEVVTSIDGALLGFPWHGASHLVLAGGAVLKHMAAAASAFKFYRSDYDFFIIGGDDGSAREAIMRVDRWVAARTGGYYMVVRTAHAISFLTEHAVYQVVLRLYGATPELAVHAPADEKSAPVADEKSAPVADEKSAPVADESPFLLGVEQLLCGFDIDPCAIAFDGARVWTIPRAERALRSNVIMVDPERQSTTALKRYRKYCYDRGFLLALPGLPEKTYAQLRVKRSLAVSNFISNDTSRSMVARLISGGRPHAAASDYAPEYEPLRLRATPWATKDQQFARSIRSCAEPIRYGTDGPTIAMSRRIDLILDTPAGETRARLQAMITQANPDFVYTPPGSPASSVQFIRRLGHGQLSGSFNPVDARNWFPDERND